MREHSLGVPLTRSAGREYCDPALRMRCVKLALRSQGRMGMPAKPIYRVVFLNQGKVYEVYARQVSQTGSLFGFVEIEELVFDARKGVVVDPAEERLRIEFAGVKRTYLPMHYVLRIDEVDKQGISKITTAEGGNVAQFPMPVYSPQNKGGPTER